MARRLLSHLRSQAVGYLALLVALGGTAYAATLPANSVGTKQLKNESVTTKKVKDDAITTGKVKDATLQAQDFAVGALPKGPTGATGATGPSGVTGSSGGADTSILWAVVKAGDGVKEPELVRGHHALSVTRLGPGSEEVKFDRDVSGCAYAATQGGGAPIYSAGIGQPQYLTVNSTFASDTVLVTTGDKPSGSVEAVDANFHLIVAC
jgi:hypothetical protein